MPVLRDILRSARYERLREILKTTREDVLDVDQELVADRIGRSQSFISSIETGGARIDSIEFLRIAKALDLDPLEVMAEVLKVEDDL